MSRSIFRYLPIFQILCLSSISIAAAPCVATCSQQEYFEAGQQKWEKTEREVEAAWNLLIQQAETPKTLKAVQAAKENWAHYRDEFCSSMATTYGGNWVSAKEVDCRQLVAEAFLKSAGNFGW